MSQDNAENYNKIVESCFGVRKSIKLPELIRQFVELLPGGSAVLDIGCGGGVPIAKFLSETGFQVTGIDVSEKLLDAAKKNVPSGTFMQVDIMELETDQTFTGIVAWDSLFHLQYDEHESAFRKIYNLLQPGGYFVFSHGAARARWKAQCTANSLLTVV
jgi:2-polyprenyl-3-methyl-5-hydroxy-6-metoxy-1,4-benzoquinol methylase